MPLCIAPSSEYESLWSNTTGSQDICVAILDGPVDLKHPCFDGADLTHLSAFPSTSNAGPVPSSHGTHVASVVFGQHNGLVRGIAPRCRGLLIPVFEASANGGVLPCSQTDLARAIALAVQHGANVINISGGQFDTSGKAHAQLERAVQTCANNGVLLVAAAGNDGCQCLHVPAALSSVLVVGAMDATGTPMDFSNWAQEYEGKGVLAPGDGVIGASLGGGITTQSGTSVATPIVSGVAALLMDVQLKRDGRIRADSVRRAILESAIGCEEKPVKDCRRLLAGRLDVSGALSHIMKGSEIEMPEQISHSNIIDSQVAACLPPSTITEVPPARPQKAAASPSREQDGVVASEAPTGSIGQSVDAACDTTQVSASDCGCGGGSSAKARIAFALGQIDYEFASESVRDSFVQQGVKIPEDAGEFLGHLVQNPSDATSVIWTLVQETTPIYAILPAGPFAMEMYSKLRDFIVGQENENIDQVSIPGTIVGKVTLCNGHTIPVLSPELRGMYSWSKDALILAALGKPPGDQGQLVMYNQTVV
ncbi:MAG: PatA/PatG family cyanobactin maturation protease, partial [Planctomycetes bacterium]|nr:PatA/PatG family cyanobactin maturation protease [Planctomycetota bacterium]